MIICELMKGGIAMNDKVGVLIDKDVKLKASFVLKLKGKDLSTAVRETLEKYAKEFDEMQKK
jgi:antitoxin component of RelBE/YafQ-DinJ toxin-antitoxin module